MAIAGIPSLSQAARGLSNLALVTPLLSPAYGPISSDPNSFGQSLGPSLMFDYEGENVVQLESEITDHFIENNSSVSDNIALKPERITVHGFKGEVSNSFPAFLPPSTQVMSTLAAIGQFAPAFSQSAMNVINGAAQAYQAVQNAANGAVSAWNSVTGQSAQTTIGSAGITALGANQTKQQLIFSQFYGYWSAQLAGRPPVLFSVQTPWAIFIPCAIEGMRWVQDEKSQEITDVSITFKMMRFISTGILQPLQQTGRAVNQYAPTTQNGSASLKPGPSVAAQASNFGLGN